MIEFIQNFTIEILIILFSGIIVQGLYRYGAMAKIKLRIKEIEDLIIACVSYTSKDKFLTEMTNSFYGLIDGFLVATPDEKLSQFIMIKMESIVNFVKDIIKIGFDDLHSDIIYEKLNIEKKEVYKQGCCILSEDFMIFFYEVHEERTNIFYDSIIDILNDDKNTKNERLKMRTKQFIVDSLRSLTLCWKQFNE